VFCECESAATASPTPELPPRAVGSAAARVVGSRGPGTAGAFQGGGHGREPSRFSAVGAELSVNGDGRLGHGPPAAAERPVSDWAFHVGTGERFFSLYF
jgi:hypothetical protein